METRSVISGDDLTIEANAPNAAGNPDQPGRLAFRVSGVEYAAIESDGTGRGLFGGSITYVHAPTGTVSIDKTVLADAVADTDVGGVLMLASGGDTPYATDVPWVIDKQLSVVGSGVYPLGDSNAQTPRTAPYLAGSVILQTAAATDGIQITVNAETVNLRDLGVRFDNPGTVAFANTGHGILCQTGVTFDTGHGLGLLNALWENVWVWGHDGNHYARVLVNSLLCTFINMRSFGGGVVRYVMDSDVIVGGNAVEVHPFGDLFVAGTAHAYAFAPFAASGSQGGLNLITFVRPQVLMNDYSALTELANPAKPTASQFMWQAQDGNFEAVNVSVYEPDLEGLAAACPANFGSATSGNVVSGGIVVTSGTITRQQAVITGVVNTNGGMGVGPSALIALTTGQKNVAVGRNALAANTSGSQNTAVGRDAAAANTSGTNNVAVGLSALAANTTTAGNVAIGASALSSQTSSGSNNVAIGLQAMQSSTGASNNVAVGVDALKVGTAAHNVALGAEALNAVTSGADNTAVGYNAGVTATSANALVSGSQNVFVGSGSGPGGTAQRSSMVAVGYQALVSDTGAIAIGAGASATKPGAIAIGRDSAGTAATSTTQDLAVIGTTLTTLQVQKLKVPGLGAFVTGDKYVVADASGNLHLSALGPAS